MFSCRTGNEMQLSNGERVAIEEREQKAKNNVFDFECKRNHTTTFPIQLTGCQLKPTN